jgi:DNA repair photolyase
MIRQASLPLIFALSPTLSNEEAALERELRRAVARKGPVVLGSAADPYDPAVRGMVRSLLETFLRQEGLEIAITTRSPRIQNDLELLTELDKRHSVTVRMALEPGMDDAAARMHAARSLAAEGITTVVLCCPAVERSGEADLRPLLREAREAGVFDVEIETSSLDRATKAGAVATFRHLRLEHGFPLDVPGRG